MTQAPRFHHERLVDEMTLVLLDVPELGDNTACAIALSLAGFDDDQIRRKLVMARIRAREVRAAEADLWARIDADRTKDHSP